MPHVRRVPRPVRHRPAPAPTIGRLLVGALASLALLAGSGIAPDVAAAGAPAGGDSFANAGVSHAPPRGGSQAPLRGLAVRNDSRGVDPAVGTPGTAGGATNPTNGTGGMGAANITNDTGGMGAANITNDTGGTSGAVAGRAGQDTATSAVSRAPRLAVTPPLPPLGWTGVRTATTAPTSAGPEPAGRPAASAQASGAAPALGPDAAAGSGPGVVAGNAFAGLSDLDNVSSTPDCAGLTERPCGEPPDPWVGVGPAHVLQVVNWRVRVTSRTGSAATGGSTASWFGIDLISAGRLPFNTDARVLYDQVHGRWLASDMAYDCTGSVLTLMVSKDPGGSPLPLGAAGWTRYTIPFPGVIADFPTLGSSSDLVAIGANRYPVHCFDPANGSLPVQPLIGTYAGASLLVLDWAALLAGGPTAPFADLGATLDPGPAPGVFAYAPARQSTAAALLHVVVAAKGTPTDPRPRAIAYTALSGIVGDVTHPATLSALPLQVVAGVGLTDPPSPADPGGLLPEAADFRITDAVWRASRLALASTVSSGGIRPRPRARVVELTTAAAAQPPAAALAQVLTVAPSPGATDTFIPGVAYASDGTLWTVYSQSGPGAFISSWARRQRTADRATVPADATFSTGATRIAAGRDAYAGINRRWGDSVGVAADPLAANAGSVWQASQFADSLEGWATFVARLDDDVTPPAAPSSIGQAFWAGHAVGVASVPLTISWGATTDAGSGLAAYQLERRIGTGGWTAVASPTALSRSLRLNAAFGSRVQFRVRAIDNAGNAGPWRTGLPFTPTKVRPSRAAGVTLAGAWTWGRCGACLGTKSRYARRAHARATLRTSGLAIAWVTVVGPTRGSARVAADGVVIGTYSTHASVGATLRVIAARSFPSARVHTFRLDVVGTAGHPRVDIDVFIVLR